MIPLRKVADREVALTSYYSKMFVLRSERKQFDYDGYIQGHVIKSAMDKTNGITDVKFTNVFDNTRRLPRWYTALAKKYTSFKLNGNTVNLNINDLHSTFNGVQKRSDVLPLIADADGNAIVYFKVKNGELLDEKMVPMAQSFEQLIGVIDANKPTEYVEVNIFGRTIPLVLILGHHLGFGNLLKTLKLNVRREAKGARLKLAPYEYALRFADETLIFNRNDDPKGLLIVNGLFRCKSLLSLTSVYDLDNKSVYSDLFDEINAPLKLLKESRDLFNLWVDPITEKILVQMKEPTDLVSLFIRAAELVTNDEHPDAIDVRFMRDKGYERIVGMIYSELVKAVREYNARPVFNNNKLTINPEAVWFAITTDQSVDLSLASNPIHNMKEKEVIVYSGAGGRSGQTMTGPTRKYHANNLGVTSEGNVDSGDAGTIIYNSFDPAYKSVYGMMNISDPNTIEPGRLVTPSFLLSPGAENDDPKRSNFIQVQNSQTTFVNGATMMPLRTGMEKVIHTRVGNMFATVAPKDGVVVEKTDTYMKVKYSDDTVESFKIGKQIGKWGGYDIPHILKPQFEKGQTFKANDTLYYNELYFTRDVADGNNVTYKNHVLARVALVENLDVFEDSCAMSNRFAGKLSSKLTHVRNVRVTIDNTVSNMVKVGDSVETDSILCTIHSAQLNSSIFNEDALKSLESISSLNPKAGYKGVIDKIHVLYTGETEDMDDKLADLVTAADAALYRESKKMGGAIKNGRVDVGYGIDGVDMILGEVVFQIYITETVGMTVADKVVVSNQLKATCARYWDETQTSEDGLEIDLMFSAKSIDNRIVLDAEKIGTTNALLVHLTDEFIKAYDK